MATYENLYEFLFKFNNEGEAIALADYMAKFNEAITNKASICTGLLKYTVKELVGMSRSMRAGKKDELVDSTYWGLITTFMAPVAVDKGWWAFSESQETWAKRIMVQLTQEMLDSHCGKVKASKAKVEKALAKPETFEEYKIWIQVNGLESLTPEMHENLDMFMAYDAVGRIREELERAAVVQKIDLTIQENLEFIVTEGWHDKRQCKIWTVRMSVRMSKEDWSKIDAKARKYGIRWSSWGALDKHGWIFYDEDTLSQFLDLQNGDGSVLDRWEKKKVEKQQKAAERLLDMAERRQESGEEDLNADRKTNTAKRAREAGYAEANAREEIKMAHILESIAKAMQDEEVFLLSGIRHANEIELLENLLERAKTNAIRKEAKTEVSEYMYWENNKDRPVSLSDIRHAEFPFPYIQEGEMKSLLKEVKGQRVPKHYLERLDNIKPINGICTTKNPDSVEGLRLALDKLIEKAGNGYNNWKYIKDRFDDYDRLFRIGIRNPYSLRATLREYMQFRNAYMPEVDRARIMELDLVGTKIPDYFPTPSWLVDRMIEFSNLTPECGAKRILEPSAGGGRIAETVRKIMPIDSNLELCEVNHRLRSILEYKDFNLVGYDFVEFAESLSGQQPYDVVIMNPPFSNDQDQKHIMLAYELLVKGGVLVAILSAGSCKQAFSDFLGRVCVEHDEILAEGTFKESGTGARTRLLVITKE